MFFFSSYSDYRTKKGAKETKSSVSRPSRTPPTRKDGRDERAAGASGGGEGNKGGNATSTYVFMPTRVTCNAHTVCGDFLLLSPCGNILRIKHAQLHHTQLAAVHASEQASEREKQHAQRKAKRFSGSRLLGGGDGRGDGGRHPRRDEAEGGGWGSRSPQSQIIF